MIPEERASVIDYWARMGINAQHIRINVDSLIKEVKIAEKQSDSMAIYLNMKLKHVKKEVDKMSEENIDLQKKFKLCETQKEEIDLKLSEIKKENTSLKKKIFWKNVTIVSTWVAVVAGTILLIQSK